MPPPRVVLFTGLKELQNVELISVDRECDFAKAFYVLQLECMVERNHAVIL